MNKMFRRLAQSRAARSLAVVASTGAALSAHAAVSTADIDAAKADALILVGAIFSVMVAVWAGKLGYRKFFGS